MTAGSSYHLHKIDLEVPSVDGASIRSSTSDSGTLGKRPGNMASTVRFGKYPKKLVHKMMHPQRMQDS